MTEKGHEIITAPDLPTPVGYAHAVVAAAGRTVHLGGQTAQAMDGAIFGSTIVEQFDLAARNLIAALHAAGGQPDDLVSLQIYVTDLAGYRASLAELGSVWRTHFGRRYPAMAVLGITELFDPAALVELVGVAVIA
ncbi:MAG: RidA family protein [Candidatus Dormiibacterota bacterium]